MTTSQNSFPVLQGLFAFDKALIGPGVVSGITLAALGISEVMGYIRIIGTAVITGLYALFLPVLVFALFGSSRGSRGSIQLRAPSTFANEIPAQPFSRA